MRQYSKISPAIWTGKTAKAIRGNLEAMVVQFYLLTSPMATMTGVYYCPVSYICSDTGLNRDAVLKGLQKLVAEGFCVYDFDSEWLFVKNMARFQVADELKPKDKRVVQMRKEAVNMPEPFKSLFSRQYNDCYCLEKRFEHEGHPSPIEGPSMPHRSQEQEQEQEQEIALTNTTPINEGREASADGRVCLCVDDGSVDIGAPFREQLQTVQLEARGDIDDPKHVMSVVDMIVTARTNGVPLSHNVKLEEIAKAQTITLELFKTCIKKWRSTQTGIGYLVGILANVAKDPSLFDEKPPVKKKEVTAETITEAQAWRFANTLANNHAFGSRFGKSGEGYNEFIPRIAAQLKDPEKFEEFRPYMVKLNLIEQGA